MTTTSFAEFLATTPAVRFGDFVLKSGRRSNVFFNFGAVCTGREILRIGEYYADFIVEHGLQDADVVFGPAYKGIALSVVTSVALHLRHGLEIPFAYNRKAEKTHAEGGSFVGYDLSRASRALVLDDVITDGGTKLETVDMLKSFPDLRISAFLVGVDREETDESGESCLSRLGATTGIPVMALTTRSEVLRFRAPER